MPPATVSTWPLTWREAEGEARRFDQIRAEYEKAPEVTRKRLYLESMEAVMSRTGKVVVDSEGTGNLMYLPLDELFKRRVQPPSFSSPDESEASSGDSGNDEALRPSRRPREAR